LKVRVIGLGDDGREMEKRKIAHVATPGGDVIAY
jgi:hypothetical protein